MKKKISLKDIAQRVGVSTALVSYVLNDQKLDRISKEVARRIKEVARELNYTTNQVAKSLKTRKTFTLGLIVADISNPFFSSLARIIEDEAAKHQYTVIFGSSDENPEKSMKLMNVLLNRQVDGLIIAPAENSESQIQYLQENDIPFVLIDRYFPQISTNYVAIDNYQASYQLARHVLEQGYTRIGFLSYRTSLFHLQERKQGYISALKEAGLHAGKQYIQEMPPGNLQEATAKAIDKLLSLPQPADALLFASNLLSTYGLRHINTLALKVPGDLGLACFDESDALHIFYAPLTYIKQPLKELGQQAVQILLETIANHTHITHAHVSAALVANLSTSRTAGNKPSTLSLSGRHLPGPLN